MVQVLLVHGYINADSEIMIGYGSIASTQVSSGTINAGVGLAMAAVGMKMMKAPTQVALGLPTLGAGMILLYKGLLKEGVLV